MLLPKSVPIYFTALVVDGIFVEEVLLTIVIVFDSVFRRNFGDMFVLIEFIFPLKPPVLCLKSLLIVY